MLFLLLFLQAAYAEWANFQTWHRLFSNHPSLGPSRPTRETSGQRQAAPVSGPTTTGTNPDTADQTPTAAGPSSRDTLDISVPQGSRSGSPTPPPKPTTTPTLPAGVGKRARREVDFSDGEDVEHLIDSPPPEKKKGKKPEKGSTTKTKKSFTQEKFLGAMRNMQDDEDYAQTRRDKGMLSFLKEQEESRQKFSFELEKMRLDHEKKLQEQREEFLETQEKKRIEWEERQEVKRREYEEKREEERQKKDDFWRRTNMEFQVELFKSFRESK